MTEPDSDVLDWDVWRLLESPELDSDVWDPLGFLDCAKERRKKRKKEKKKEKEKEKEDNTMIAELAPPPVESNGIYGPICPSRTKHNYNINCVMG